MWFRKKKTAPTEPEAPLKQSPSFGELVEANAILLEKLQQLERKPRECKPYNPPRGVIPEAIESAMLAMDSMPYSDMSMNELGEGFAGYPYLAQLAQRPEYRKISGTIAEEMTRKWIKLKSRHEDEDNTRVERINTITTVLEKLNARKLFHLASLHDGYFGRGQLYIEMRTPQGTIASVDPGELETQLFLSPLKITRNSLVGLRAIEPFWTYPGLYNASNPLSTDFYTPPSWYVQGKTVHATRLLTFISRPVPDLLKPVYNFGGLSLSQMAETYVANWLRTRDSVSDMVHSYSTTGIATNLQATLQGATCDANLVGGSIFARAAIFNNVRDSRGVMLIDKGSEEFFQFNTPLSGLNDLQAQAQEQMASVSSIPLVKLLGITPSGLNASSDGEIRVFYDYIHAMQESIYREPLKKLIDIIQLSEFGDIDPDITFDFEPLLEMNEKEKAEIRKTDADADAALIGAGVISADEARQRLASSPDSPYHSLELNDEEVTESEEDDTQNFAARET